MAARDIYSREPGPDHKGQDSRGGNPGMRGNHPETHHRTLRDIPEAYRGQGSFRGGSESHKRTEERSLQEADDVNKGQSVHPRPEVSVDQTVSQISQEISQRASRRCDCQHGAAAFDAHDCMQARGSHRTAVDSGFPGPVDKIVLFQASSAEPMGRGKALQA